MIRHIGRLVALPSRNFQTSQKEFIAAQEEYFEQLCGIDNGVLSKAIGLFSSGKLIQDGQTEQWFPSPAAIANQCRKIVQEMASDRARNRDYDNSINQSRGTPTDNTQGRTLLSEKISFEQSAAELRKHGTGSLYVDRTGQVWSAVDHAALPPRTEKKRNLNAIWEQAKADMRGDKEQAANETPKAAADRLEALAAENGKQIDWSKMKDQPQPAGWSKAK